MRRRVVAGALLATLTAGCGSSAGGGTAGAGSAAGGAPPRKVELGLAANGRSVSVHPNDVIEVRLQSTYWKFAKVAGGVVSPGTSVSRAAHSPVPGSGRGTVIATFRALEPGTAHITATRQSCGEAMRCVGGQGSFTMTIVVR